MNVQIAGGRRKLLRLPTKNDKRLLKKANQVLWEIQVTDLEVGATTFARFALVSKIEKSALRPVEDKPAFIPRLET